MTTESYDKSDIVADLPDQGCEYDNNKPFVIKTTPCGQLGHYMHLTPDYLLNDTIGLAYGPYEKVKLIAASRVCSQLYFSKLI